MFWKKIFTNKHKSEDTHGSKQKTHEPKATARELKAKKVKVSVGFLQKLQPIGLLAEAELRQVEVLLAEFAAGEVIYKESETLAYLAYVVAGEVYCESSEGAQYDVVANTFKALYPLLDLLISRQAVPSKNWNSALKFQGRILDSVF